MKALTSLSSVAALCLGLSLTGNAKANCCHDFWSCAAAVASAGLSCAAQAAVDEVNKFVERVERTKQEGTREMQQRLGEMGRGMQQACTAPVTEMAKRQAELRGSLSAAEEAARPVERGRPEEAQAALTRARDQVAALQTATAEEFRTDVTAKHKAAMDRRRAALTSVDRAFQATFVAPLAGLVAPLVAAVDPIAAAATLAVVAGQLERIQHETDRVMAKEIRDAEAAVRTEVDRLKQEEAEHLANAERAKAISDAMKQVASNPSNANVGRLKNLLEPERASAPSAKAVQLKLTPAITNLYFQSQATPELLANVRLQLREQAKLARAPKKPFKFDEKVAKKQRDQGLARRLAGKKGPALEEEKLKLLAEAKERIPEEKARKAVEAMIEEEVRTRQKL